MAAVNDLDLSRAAWRKSSYSNNGGACVEVAHVPVRQKNAASGSGVNLPGAVRPAVAVRDSKDPDGPALVVGPAAWQTFAARLKVGGAGL